MTKVCTKCGTEKEMGEFWKDGRLKSGRCAECKLCQKQRNQEYYRRNRCQIIKRQEKWTAQNRDKVREAELLRKYNLSLADYHQMLASQGGKCAMCGSAKPGGHGTFHVDHDHTTGAVRGLLCHHCNVGLGHLGDEPKRAAEMLWRYGTETEQYLDYAI